MKSLRGNTLFSAFYRCLVVILNNCSKYEKTFYKIFIQSIRMFVVMKLYELACVNNCMCLLLSTGCC